jgi:amidohydrolase
MDIEFVIVKEVSAREPIIFNVGSIHGGEANNVICNHASMFCTLRTHTDETAAYVIDKIKRIGEAVASTAGGRFEYTQKKFYPVVYNNPEVEAKLRLSAKRVVGEENMYEKKRSMGGEDFSYFANQKPGCMFRLGIKNDELGMNHGLHTSLFNVDERGIAVGIAIFKDYVLNNMK